MLCLHELVDLGVDPLHLVHLAFTVRAILNPAFLLNEAQRAVVVNTAYTRPTLKMSKESIRLSDAVNKGSNFVLNLAEKSEPPAEVEAAAFR